MIERFLFITGICVFIGTFTACNYSLWFHEAEAVTEEVLTIEKEASNDYDIYRQEPYIQSQDHLDKILHSDANRWSIKPSGSPEN